MKHRLGPRFSLSVWLLALLAAIALTACYPREYIPSGEVVHSHDSWVKDGSSGGPEIELVDFQWRYLNDTDQIRLWGNALNKGAKPVQSIRLIIDAFDQFNYHLGTAETYLNPTYIQPDGKATFEFYIPRGEWVEHIRLRYRVESRVG